MARPGLMRHRKFAQLALAVGDEALARGHLELIWEVAYENGDDLVGDGPAVEFLSRWKGEAGRLSSALIASGFLDESDDGLRVHDLWDHAPDYVRKRREREDERTKKGKNLKGPKKSRPPNGAERRQAEPNGAEREAPPGAPSPSPSPSPQTAPQPPTASPTPDWLPVVATGVGEKLGQFKVGLGDPSRRDELVASLGRVVDLVGEAQAVDSLAQIAREHLGGQVSALTAFIGWVDRVPDREWRRVGGPR